VVEQLGALLTPVAAPVGAGGAVAVEPGEDVEGVGLPLFERIYDPSEPSARRHEHAGSGMRVRPTTWACHQADLNAREKFLGIGVEMHVPRPT
jgi:hypothetical protein